MTEITIVIRRKEIDIILKREVRFIKETMVQKHRSDWLYQIGEDIEDILTEMQQLVDNRKTQNHESKSSKEN